MAECNRREMDHQQESTRIIRQKERRFMKHPRQLGGAAALTALFGTIVSLAGSTAFGAMYMTPAGSTDSNGSVDATASIVVGSGKVTVILTDLLENPTSSGQTLSGIDFTVSGQTGTATLASSSGNTSTINSDGTYSAGVYTSTLGHWGADNSVNLSTIGIFGHKAYDLIVGPDNAGGFSGAGKYSAANGGFDNFDAYVLGSATFTVNVPGVTSASTLSGVTFEFGTGPEEVSGVIVPEPGFYGASAGAFALLPLGAGMLLRLRNKQ